MAEPDLQNIQENNLSVRRIKNKKRGSLIEHRKEDTVYCKYNILRSNYLYSAYCMQLFDTDFISVYYFLCVRKYFGSTGT